MTHEEFLMIKHDLTKLLAKSMVDVADSVQIPVSVLLYGLTNYKCEVPDNEL